MCCGIVFDERCQHVFPLGWNVWFEANLYQVGVAYGKLKSHMQGG